MSELQQFFQSHAGEPKNLDRRPRPERKLLDVMQTQHFVGGGIKSRWPGVAVAVAGATDHPPVVSAFEVELLALGNCGGTLKDGCSPKSLLLGRGHHARSNGARVRVR